jgi:hypothetical protein
MGKAPARNAVTLAIESTDVRLLTARNGRVDKWSSVPLPSGLIAEGVITDPAEMGKILDELLKVDQLDRKHVITSLAGLRAIPRILNLPRLQASLMEQTIAREARREMPLSMDNLYISWQSLPAEGEQQRIYLLGLPREPVDAQVRSLQAAGITPYVMDLKPLALIRVANQEEAVITNLERDTFDVILVSNYAPTIMRTFSLAADTGDTQARVDRLLEELAQTIRFYNDSHRGATLKPATAIHISGRELNNAEMLEYMRSASDRAVERLTPPMPCPEDLPVMEYATNLGLLLKKV